MGSGLCMRLLPPSRLPQRQPISCAQTKDSRAAAKFRTAARKGFSAYSDNGFDPGRLRFQGHVPYNRLPGARGSSIPQFLIRYSSLSFASSPSAITDRKSARTISMLLDSRSKKSSASMIRTRESLAATASPSLARPLRMSRTPKRPLGPTTTPVPSSASRRTLPSTTQ